MISAISSSLYSKVWIDVETNPSSGCSWSGHDSASNCNFVTEIVNRIKAKGKHAGIYGSKTMWTSIFGSASACHTLGAEPLWYAHYDGHANFQDFGSFGGWTKPAMKQYLGDVNMCGAGVDKNYLP
jgi:GH25 family lysozyme M1 (1,4-beta-N-acetylmuramidase)